MYYRMSIPCLLKGITHTALYLDTDVLCLGNIDDLFEIDISNSLIAAVPDAILYRAYIKQLNQFGFTRYWALFQLWGHSIQYWQMEWYGNR